jgi:hypothetical protein
VDRRLAPQSLKLRCWLCVDKRLSESHFRRHEHPWNRRGKPVVELKPIPPVAAKSRRVTEADLEWLRERRAHLPPSKVDAGTFISQMRDEEWER